MNASRVDDKTFATLQARLALLRRAVTGVRMMSQSSKKAPKAREVVLNTACIRARSV